MISINKTITGHVFFKSNLDDRGQFFDTFHRNHDFFNYNFLSSNSAQTPLIHLLKGKSPISEKDYLSEHVKVSKYTVVGFQRFRPFHDSHIFHGFSAFQTSPS